MMYPPEKGNRNRLQKIFIASTQFNLLFAEYFKKCGNNVLEDYINSLVAEYVKDSGITPEKLIEHIENKYQDYLNSLPADNGNV